MPIFTSMPTYVFNVAIIFVQHIFVSGSNINKSAAFEPETNCEH